MSVQSGRIHRRLEEGNVRFMMQEVMGEVVTDVAKDTAAEYHGTDIPVEREYSMSQVPERCSKSQEKCWGHDKTKFVHGKVVMNSMKKEMHGNRYAIVRHFPGSRKQKHQ